MIAVAKIDPKRYGKLLAEKLPTVIETGEDNERMLGEIHKLMLKGDSLSPEEEAILELMSKLVESFEEEHYHIEPAPPNEVLLMLMEDRGLRQRDLLGIFGSRGIASEVVNGKRAISKRQARLLGNFFHVSPELFLWSETPKNESGYKKIAATHSAPSTGRTAQLSFSFEIEEPLGKTSTNRSYVVTANRESGWRPEPPNNRPSIKTPQANNKENQNADLSLAA